MTATVFERHITRFELNNQTILIEDDQGNDHGVKFSTNQVVVKSDGKSYHASIRDFYIGSKFKPGIAFDHEEGHMNDFFFDQSVSENKRAKISFDPDSPIEDGKAVVSIEVYIVTK